MNKLETARQLAKQTAAQKPSTENLPPGYQTSNEQVEQDLINFLQATQKILDISTQNQQILAQMEKKIDGHMKQVRMLKLCLMALLTLIMIASGILIWK